MSFTSAERTRAYRARRKASGLPDNTRRYQKEYVRDYRRAKRTERRFCGCDGEGCGTDEKGRQLYYLFRMGERELYTGAPLATYEILDFICDADRNDILVGFVFGYDVTMILRDLPERQARRLFEPVLSDKGHSRYVWFKNFDIEYLPKNYFRVKRVKIVRLPDGSEKRIPIEGSQRTIFETFGFFQKSFLNAIKSFKIGTEAERTMIAGNKARRSEFETISQEERDYCALECRFLADLMETLRSYCDGAGIVPRTWNGAGKLASALHALHNTPRRDAISFPDELKNYANMAYYGGRFEVTRTGNVQQKVWEYDICSAYPSAMRRLPCLLHGEWRFVRGSVRSKNGNEIYCARVTFTQSQNGNRGFGQLGGLPIRSKEGHIFWPRQGGGIYWSVEIDAARKLGVNVKIHDAWVYEKHCDCQPFDWVEPLYDYRKSIGSQGPGYPIKLAINSLYGKLAQRKGNGIYCHMIWAGLITAYTRAELMKAIAMAPDDIIMCATDAVYSLRELPELDVGEKLGQWEKNELDGLFIVQPGLYWSPERRKKKSRGLSSNFFEQKELTIEFERVWNFWHSQNANGLDESFPSVRVPVTNFIGLNLALSWNKHEKAGQWVRDFRDISFDYGNKRRLHEWRDDHIITGIKPGSPGLLSLPHSEFLKTSGQEPWERLRSLYADELDAVEFAAPTWEN